MGCASATVAGQAKVRSMGSSTDLPDPGLVLGARRRATPLPDRVLVMRHADHDGGRVGALGRRQIDDVARALSEWCVISHSEIDSVTGITPSDSFGLEVLNTAKRMQREIDSGINAIRAQRVGPAPRLADIGLQQTYLQDGPNCATHLIVLNEPQASTYIEEMSGAKIGLRKAELALLERANHLVVRGRVPFVGLAPYRAVWTMAPAAPEGDPLLAEIRAKVESKMRTAAVLGGLITALLTFVLTRLFDGEIGFDWVSFASLVAFGVSAALFFVAMFFYDSLTMPAAFWASGAPGRASRHRWLLARPPSATSRVLQLNMLRIWSKVFVPAVLALGVGLATLFASLDGTSSGEGVPQTAVVELDWGHTLLLAGTAGLVALWSLRFRPRIGSRD